MVAGTTHCLPVEKYNNLHFPSVSLGLLWYSGTGKVGGGGGGGGGRRKEEGEGGVFFI